MSSRGEVLSRLAHLAHRSLLCSLLQQRKPSSLERPKPIAVRAVPIVAQARTIAEKSAFEILLMPSPVLMHASSLQHDCGHRDMAGKRLLYLLASDLQVALSHVSLGEWCSYLYRREAGSHFLCRDTSSFQRAAPARAPAGLGLAEMYPCACPAVLQHTNLRCSPSYHQRMQGPVVEPLATHPQLPRWMQCPSEQRM